MADNNIQNGVFGGVNYEDENSKEWTTSGNQTINEWTINENSSYNNSGNESSNPENSVKAGVYGSFATGANAGSYNDTIDSGIKFQPITREKAITKQGLWTKIKAFLFQEVDLNAPIKVELTPYQQKVEDEINEFLHQDVSFKNISSLFKSKK